MKRTLIRIVLATAFVGAGWSLGRAQTQVAEFEIAVDSPRGDVKLTCSRGCDWSREVSQGFVSAITFQCQTDRCIGMLNGHGRIMRGIPLR